MMAIALNKICLSEDGKGYSNLVPEKRCQKRIEQIV